MLVVTRKTGEGLLLTIPTGAETPPIRVLIEHGGNTSTHQSRWCIQAIRTVKIDRLDADRLTSLKMFPNLGGD